MSSFLSNYLAKHEAQRAELISKYGENFEKPADSFGLNVAERKCISDWANSLVPEILAKQNGSGLDVDGDTPYYGAVGGGLTYSFVPTSLGTIIMVKELTTGKELNVTDALGWYFYD